MGNIKNIFYKLNYLRFYFSFLFVIFFISANPATGQISANQITSIKWENNSLVINTTQKITYAESRLKEPERLVIDILNCSFQNKGLEKRFKSELEEDITVSEPTTGQIRIIFLGSASMNRKSYLTNNERTLITKIARINTDEEKKIFENEQQSSLEKYVPGFLKEINIEEEDHETEVVISTTKSIKYNTYTLKNPDRLAIDLLNIIPPKDPLPKYMATQLVSGVRVGRAASNIDATRVVIDLSRENLDCDVDSTLLGNKLKIKFKINKEKEEIVKKSGIKIVIDPGHGGYDTGASYGGFEEKAVNLIIAEKLKKILEDSGITVFLTRDDDSFLSLAERVEITHSIRPNVFISIHGNALKTSRGIRGVETYYWNSQSQKLAYYIHKSILSHLTIPDHFIRRARFYVIHHTSSPAVLAELGFLSNHDDRKLLTNSTTQDQYAKALSEAILKFLDLDTESKPEVKSKKQEEQKLKEKKNE